VYPAASVGVVLDKVAWKQRHFTGHTDAITAAALHPDRVHVATGQRGSRPYVAVWSSLTVQVGLVVVG
jgi:hypothetical protein